MTAPRVVWRRQRPGDLAAFQAHRRDPDLARCQGGSARSDADARAFFDEKAAVPLFVHGEWAQLGITDARNLASLRLLERLGFAPRETRSTVFKGEPCVEVVCVLESPSGV